MGESMERMPEHIGIIMDGNGRWAAGRGLPRTVGHKQGADVLERIVKHVLKIGVSHLTVFVLSTENFSRPPEEVDAIVDLMRSYLKQQRRRNNRDICIRFLGDCSVLPLEMQQDILALEEETKGLKKLHLNFAVNYGGRQDILQAAQHLARDYQSGKVGDLAEIDIKIFAKYLYTEEQPDIDLLIRTSGEQRISNFLLWQCAYAEFVFAPTLWPDFSTALLDRAIAEYQNRDRRMGKIN